jgi:hypothetical protein
LKRQREREDKENGRGVVGGKRTPPAMKVPRQCPLVLLVEVILLFRFEQEGCILVEFALALGEPHASYG